MFLMQKRLSFREKKKKSIFCQGSQDQDVYSFFAEHMPSRYTFVTARY